MTRSRTTPLWVTTAALGGDAVGRWMRLPEELDGDGVEVSGWGSDEQGRGEATLRVDAAALDEAVTIATARLHYLFGEDVAGQMVVRTTPPAGDECDDDVRDEHHEWQCHLDDDELVTEAQPRMGGLEWRRCPLLWDVYAVDEAKRLLQVHYVQAGTGTGPGAAIAEVLVSESETTIAVTLFERVLAGTFPDGAVTAQAQAAVLGCLSVRLSQSLRQRRIIDGASGRAARRLSPLVPGDVRHIEHALRWGCPLWSR